MNEQAGAELCQAQFKLGLAKTAFPDVDIVFVFVFPVLKVWSCLPFTNKWSCLPFAKNLSSSSIYKNIEVVFHLPKNWGRLPFTKKLRLSSNLFRLIYLSFNYYMAYQADFQLFYYYSGRAGGWVAGLNENKANSANQLKLELGLGKILFLVMIYSLSAFKNDNGCEYKW